MTHLRVDGKENLVDGEPYGAPERRQFMMEVGVIASEGTRIYYVNRVNAFRIETGV